MTMNAENVPSAREKESTPGEDNALKFIVLQVPEERLVDLGAQTFEVSVQWTEVTDDSETKLVRKGRPFEPWDDKFLRITKSRPVDGGSRSAVRETLGFDEFRALRLAAEGLPYMTKRRSEFTYVQNDIEFTMKYDEFNVGTKLGTVDAPRLFCMLEVDAASDKERERFDPEAFDLAAIYADVTGKEEYTGVRIVETLQRLQG